MHRWLFGAWIFMFWTQFHSFSALRPLKLGFVILALVVMALAAHYLFSRTAKITKSQLAFAVICLLNLCMPLISSVANDRYLLDMTQHTYLSYAKILLVAALVPFIFTSESHSRPFLMMNGFCIATGLAYMVFSHYNAGQPLGARLDAEFGKFSNANAIATVIAASAPFLLQGFFESKRALARAFFLICLLAAVILVVLTKSRMGLASGLAASSLYFLGESWKRQALTIGLGSLTLATVGAVTLSLDPDFFQRFSSTAEGSLSLRIHTWHAALYAFVDRPIFGVGFDQARNFFFAPGFVAPLFTEVDPKDIHNLWLKVAAEMGIVGLALFTSLFTMTAVAIWKNRTGQAAIAKASACSLAALFLNSLTLPLLTTEFWIVLLACLYALNTTKKPVESKTKAAIA